MTGQSGGFRRTGAGHSFDTSRPESAGEIEPRQGILAASMADRPICRRCTGFEPKASGGGKLAVATRFVGPIWIGQVRYLPSCQVLEKITVIGHLCLHILARQDGKRCVRSRMGADYC